MAVTPANFKARFTEFIPAADALVQAALDAAARECDPRVYGDRTDDAVGWLAAHNLAVSPQGRSARLESDKATTTYFERFAQIRRQKAGGAWAIGQRPA